MNTPETINIEKYAEALNNLVGMDIGYLGESDENVNAIVEVIRVAKALELRVKELEEEVGDAGITIVRCKDCKHYRDWGDCTTCMKWTVDYDVHTDPDAFCSYGEPEEKE